MVERLSTHWWLFLIRGILALALGILAPLFPAAALFGIAILFGAYAFVDGIVAIWTATRLNHADGRWLWLLLEGLLGIVVGIYCALLPGSAALTLGLLLGFWAVFTGALAIGSAFSARRHVRNEWLWVLSGIVSVLFGIAIFFAPALGLLALVWMLSVYALLAGIFFIGLALRLRGMSRSRLAA
jgi:uncharacterized membrane protein HdeD (DUF308 family)